MAIYGFGANFGGNDSQLENFINQGFVCVGYSKVQKPEYYDILQQIKTGDLIYIKSMWNTDKEMRLKAVGIATSDFQSKNNHQGYEQTENQIDVKWIATFDKSLSPIAVNDSQINERKNTIFKENNSDIIKQIIDLIK